MGTAAEAVVERDGEDTGEDGAGASRAPLARRATSMLRAEGRRAELLDGRQDADGEDGRGEGADGAGGDKGAGGSVGGRGSSMTGERTGGAGAAWTARLLGDGTTRPPE